MSRPTNRGRMAGRKGTAMAVQCPHCDGQIGSAPSLVGKRVMCPHCSGHFIMRENTTSPPAESSKPIATNQELSTAALLDNMLQAQVATNILLQKILAHQADTVCLRRADGEQIKVPMEKLIDEDIAWIKQHGKQ